MDHHHEITQKTPFIEYVKFAILILLIFLISLLFGEGNLENFLRYFMAFFFLTFGAFKLIGYSTFVHSYRMYDLIAQRFKPWGYIYPFLEITLGVIYLIAADLILVNIFVLVLMIINSIGVFIEIRSDRKIKCACLGDIIKLPLSTVSLLEDVGMGLMALAMIVISLV